MLTLNNSNVNEPSRVMKKLHKSLASNVWEK